MIREIFTAKHVVPQIYKTVLDQNLGPEWISWEPETCWSEIDRIFKIRPSENVANKINALKVFLTTKAFYQDARAFENIVLAVNDLYVDPQTLQVCSPEEIVYALKVLAPLGMETKNFGREIIAYIQVACKQVGLLKYPDDIKFAEPAYDKPLAELAASVKAQYVDPEKIDYADIQQVQGSKLYVVQMYAAEKFARMDIKNLEKAK